ncbi:hypothetical protein QTA58_16790 [Neorhizobium sp. CSC1952]|uniref:hypothetical protein n=1 Tax=Neorhizobium sp. CSC1952 TaxID=2978974 RepID=UPI0025A5EB19|nr:hypothetical protein [Rhizobium sp. CSC1952]WJR65876.1 hypothetical protein QTA58_16790 [Rhizobium sp. CSC1952]
MRSFIKTTVFSALMLSTLVGGAFAASGGIDDSSGDYYEGIDPHADALNPPIPRMAPMTTSSIHRTMAERPRLTHVLSELRVYDRRINRLRPVAANSARHEEADIRAQAMAVADRHDGVIPGRNYQQLQREIRKLDRDIVRSS